VLYQQNARKSSRSLLASQASKSLSEIGKSREQNSQSTLMKPSSSTISARSSGPNREMTSRI
jgi:hypothetical protein